LRRGKNPRRWKSRRAGKRALRYFGNFSMPDRLHDFIQGDVFFNYLLLRVLRYPEAVAPSSPRGFPLSRE
jgi:hypothetical protein